MKNLKIYDQLKYIKKYKDMYMKVYLIKNGCKYDLYDLYSLFKQINAIGVFNVCYYYAKKEYKGTWFNLNGEMSFDDKIEDVFEKSQGWKYVDEQIGVIKLILKLEQYFSRSQNRPNCKSQVKKLLTVVEEILKDGLVNTSVWRLKN